VSNNARVLNTKIGNLFSVPRPSTDTQEHLFGIELELENVRLQPHIAGWEWTQDGSLRNYGAELVLRTPLGGSALIEAISLLDDSLRHIEGMQEQQIQATNRCATHCHIDMRDCTLEQVISFYVAWLLFEPALYTVGGKDRYSSIYCPGASSAPGQVFFVSRLYNAQSALEAKRIIHDWCKYTGVNLRSLASLGSIEIRSHKGTKEAQDVLLWVRLLTKLKEYSAARTPEQILKDADELGTDIAQLVFGELASCIQCDNFFTYFNNAKLHANDVVWYEKLKTFNKPAAESVEAIADAIVAALRGE